MTSPIRPSDLTIKPIISSFFGSFTVPVFKTMHTLFFILLLTIFSYRKPNLRSSKHSPKTPNETNGWILIFPPNILQVSEQNIIQMHKLFRTSNGNVFPTFRNLLKNAQIFTPCPLLLHTVPKSKLDFIMNEVEELQSSKPINQITQSATEPEVIFDLSGTTKAERATVQISHPWPEWVDLMECLLRRGYFESNGNPFRNGEMGPKGSNYIRTACLNFARDRFDLIR